MIYEIKLRVDSEELKHFHFPENSIIKPAYKNVWDDQEKNWILSHAKLIEGTVAWYIYDLYCEDFTDKQIVTKTKFYQACREILGLEMRVISIENETRNCFVSSKSR